MAVWIGVAMMIPGDVKRSFKGGIPAKPELDALRGRVAYGGKVGPVGGIGTILTGVGLIFLLGGFAAVPPAIHVSLVLAIGLAVLGVVFIGGAWRRIDERIGPEGTGASRDDIAPLLRRYRVLSMMFKTGWLVILVLMVFRTVLR